jgi:shikimate dehydrogenase
MHNYWFQESKLDSIYLTFSVEKPEKSDLISWKKMGICGLSVTIPHKEWAFQVADFRDSGAENMKAANTLIFKEDGIHAYNTDGFGAVQAVQNFDRKLISQKSTKDILILGTGGSARGISFSIAEELKKSKSGQKIFISGRSPEKAEALCKDLNQIFPGSSYPLPLFELQVSEPDYLGLIIHTTNLGMKGMSQEAILPQTFFAEDMVLFDIVYNPRETKLIKEAKKSKTKIIYGIDMLLFQGVRQFELFTGRKPSKTQIDSMGKRLKQALK